MLVGIGLVVGPSAVASGAHAKSPSFKTGTYKAKPSGASSSITPAKFSFTLKSAKCATAPGRALASHLCVTLPTTPEVQCNGPVNTGDSLGSFATPLSLPASGKLTEQVLTTGSPALPGEPPSTGQATFSVTLTKKGTATGYFEQTLMQIFQKQPIPCKSGKVAFTAKLG